MVDKSAVFSDANRVDAAVYAHDVFTLTEAGTAQIHSGATGLPSEALAILVMLDGKRTVGDLEQQAPQIAPELLRNLMRSLIYARLVRGLTMEETGEVSLDFTAFFAAAATDEEPSAGTQASADREAELGAPRLEREGYYISIAREALKPRVPAAGGKFQAFIVEDDPDMAALVKRLLGKAGIDASIAATRAEVLARLGSKPSPDLVILDVMLPDLNGFELLQRLKTHPALKLIPVVMLTADAKRESVVRGLTAGADGYITKPFDHDVMLRGVKAVLGISA